MLNGIRVCIFPLPFRNPSKSRIPKKNTNLPHCQKTKSNVDLCNLQRQPEPLVGNCCLRDQAIAVVKKKNKNYRCPSLSWPPIPQPLATCPLLLPGASSSCHRPLRSRILFDNNVERRVRWPFMNYKSRWLRFV